VIESPGAKLKREELAQPQADQTPMVSSTPLAPQTAAPTPLVAAPSPATLAPPRADADAAPTTTGSEPDASNAATDNSAADTEPAPPRKRSNFDPRNQNLRPKAALTPRPLPTLSQIEGPKAAAKRPAPPKVAAKTTVPLPTAPTTAAKPETLPPAAQTQAQAPTSARAAPAPQTQPRIEDRPQPQPLPQKQVRTEPPKPLATPEPALDDSPAVALHSYPSGLMQDDDSSRAQTQTDAPAAPPSARTVKTPPVVAQQSAPLPQTAPAPAPAPVTPSVNEALPATPPVAAVPSRPPADGDDFDLDLKQYIPSWLGKMPADLALMGVLGLCIVFGLIAATIRRSHETFD
jgi:hypothetical protein